MTNLSMNSTVANHPREEQTLLLVDDSENDLILMRMAFQKAASNVSLQEVRNGVEAIAYLSGEGIYANRLVYPLPSAVLMDLKMPHKNGFEVLAWAQGRASLSGIPIIIMTASMRPEDVKEAYDLGANSYLVKPIQIEDLITMIACVVEWLRINHFPPRNRIANAGNNNNMKQIHHT